MLMTLKKTLMSDMWKILKIYENVFYCFLMNCRNLRIINLEEKSKFILIYLHFSKQTFIRLDILHTLKDSFGKVTSDKSTVF